MNKQEKLLRNVQYLRTLRVIREKSDAHRKQDRTLTSTPTCERSEQDGSERSQTVRIAPGGGFEKEA